MPITRYWTSYWKEKNWSVNTEYEPIRFSGGSFKSRGVSEGDVLYIISLRDGQLLLGGRMTVERIVTRQEAVQIRKRSDLYDTKTWAVAQKGSGTPLHQHRQLTPEVTKQIRFVSVKSALLFADDRRLNGQTARNPRELTIESVSLLDEIIQMTDAQRQPTIVSDEQLRRYRAKRDLAQALHEEISDGAIYIEGSVKQVRVNRYERDANARDACICHHGELCSVCNIDMKAAYGEVAAGFIHVHHLIQLSSLGPDYVVDPLKDLRPVCPNCHAIIHRRNPPYSISDVKSFIEAVRSDRP